MAWDRQRAGYGQPLSHGQHVTLGVATVTSGDGNPGGQLVAWIRCE